MEEEQRWLDDMLEHGGYRAEGYNPVFSRLGPKYCRGRAANMLYRPAKYVCGIYSSIVGVTNVRPEIS